MVTSSMLLVHMSPAVIRITFLACLLHFVFMFFSGFYTISKIIGTKWLLQQWFLLYQASSKSGIKLHGDQGEIVSLKYQTSLCFELNCFTLICRYTYTDKTVTLYRHFKTMVGCSKQQQNLPCFTIGKKRNTFLVNKFAQELQHGKMVPKANKFSSMVFSHFFHRETSFVIFPLQCKHTQTVLTYVNSPTLNTQTNQ